MKPRTGAALVLLLAGAGIAADGAWLKAKAWLGQVLLERAWTEAERGARAPKPWSWADTWPVARLSAPAHAVEQIVLAGASGRVLAWGPGHVPVSAPPGASGNTVFSGHRDTHFAWLRRLRPGDDLLLDVPGRPRLRYAVIRIGVHHQDEGVLLDPVGEPVLTLITCYPFEDWVPGGPLRYVVQAAPVLL